MKKGVIELSNFRLDPNSPITNFLLGVALAGGNVEEFAKLLKKDEPEIERTRKYEENS